MSRDVSRTSTLAHRASATESRSSGERAPEPADSLHGIRLQGVARVSVKFLTQEWVRAAQDLADSDSEFAGRLAGAELTVSELVRSGPNGDIEWHFAISEGRVNFGLGATENPDLSISQGYATAASIAQGALDAQQAFMTGQILIRGDMDKAATFQHQYLAVVGLLNDVETEF